MKNPSIGILGRSIDEMIDSRRGIEETNKTLVFFGAIPVNFVYPEKKEELDDNAREYIYKSLEVIDGLIIPGGHREFNIYDIEFVKRCIEKDIPLLGICKGMQTMAIATSGRIRKLSDNSIHNSKKNHAHNVLFTENSYLKEILNTNSLDVNSRHDCYVVDSGLYKVVAKCDGVIEAIEFPKNKFNIGVQWHPESMYLNNKEMSLLFADFVIACEDYKLNKNKD